ncbi:uncharacterized protein LOC110717827 [Chenopodium quinoa]|uniref:uncharacterized protein LOC110717827 n=1 Tax=Chenopodium quinoa TaxID=63459 RepID=UPI000B79AA3F|nr:uncharacterized protein LOC110717827 [Chenopodium quinoa]
MEGLIPMVYKVIKRNKVRRQYRCLSVGAAQTYNIADFYDYGNEHDHDQGATYDVVTRSEPSGGVFDGRSHGHRRYGSTGEYGYNFNYDHDNEVYGVGRNSSSPPKQIMKRYRSHRMFSCLTGGM